MCFSRCKRFAVVSLLLAGSSCVHSPRLRMPEQCSPMPDRVVCAQDSYQFGSKGLAPDAGSFVCYRPEEILPFLESCGAK